MPLPQTTPFTRMTPNGGLAGWENQSRLVLHEVLEEDEVEDEVAVLRTNIVIVKEVEERNDPLRGHTTMAGEENLRPQRQQLRLRHLKNNLLQAFRVSE